MTGEPKAREPGIREARARDAKTGETVETKGFYSVQELAKSPGYPSRERMMKGPVAVIECTQEIPCNPCEAACPHGAITVGLPITRCPELDGEECTGCGLCIAACPGLAVFVVDMCFAPGRTAVSFPYEYLPLAARGDKVTACDRSGHAVCEAEVLKVLCPPRNDHTAVVTVVVPTAFAQEVRGIVRPGGGIVWPRGDAGRSGGDVRG
ncbi:MAG: 4Fe-4S binding protein [Bacillota bacterium]|nr:4Fe-4S binding protein [Bacillota bacterium]